MYPTDRRYSKEHEWILVDGDLGTVGITDYAQKELGDIVFVEVSSLGDEVKAGDVMGTIESVKAVSELYSPVTGTVEAFNEALEADPEKVNGEPHGEGWICKIRISDSSQLDDLMDAAAYEQFIG